MLLTLIFVVAACGSSDETTNDAASTNTTSTGDASTDTATANTESTDTSAAEDAETETPGTAEVAVASLSYDGYGIYGPEENGEVPSDLDECSPNLPACRVGASAVGALTSPDNPSASLPGGEGRAGGGPPPRDES